MTKRYLQPLYFLLFPAIALFPRFNTVEGFSSPKIF